MPFVKKLPTWGKMVTRIVLLYDPPIDMHANVTSV